MMPFDPGLQRSRMSSAVWSGEGATRMSGQALGGNRHNAAMGANPLMIAAVTRI